LGVATTNIGDSIMKQQGRVKWFNDEKGFGFIACDQGDVFVHYKAITAEGRKTLHENDLVEFTVTQGKKGLQAEDVTVVEGA
jgi:cold shock protein